MLGLLSGGKMTDLTIQKPPKEGWVITHPDTGAILIESCYEPTIHRAWIQSDNVSGRKYWNLR